MSTEPKKRDLVVTRVFDAPVELVWKAWTDPERVMRWWGPEGFTSPTCKMDFREGGTTLVCMSSPEYGDLYSTWQYRGIVPMKRIEYIHNLADKDGHKIDPAAIGMPADFPRDQLHIVTFKAVGDNKTEMTVTEYDWTVGQMMEMSKMGLNQCLDKMETVLKEGDKLMKNERTNITAVPDMKLELVPVPVSDVDRARAFYFEKVGFNLDHDVRPSDAIRVVQLTPPGSACSIVIGTGMGEISEMKPGSVKGLHLVVADIRKAREILAGRGVEVSEVVEYPRGIKFVYFSDPDGNSWALQEIPANL